MSGAAAVAASVAVTLSALAAAEDPQQGAVTVIGLTLFILVMAAFVFALWKGAAMVDSIKSKEKEQP